MFAQVSNQKPPKDFSREEQLLILEAIEKEPLHVQILPIFLLETGLRISEATSLTLGDLRKGMRNRQAYFTVKTLKQKKGSIVYRDVPIKKNRIHAKLDYSLYSKIKEYLKTRDKHPDYAAFLMNPCIPKGMAHSNRNTLSKFIKALAARIGCPDRSAHTFRHTCAYNLLESGASLTVVQQWLGHKTLAATTVYVMAKRDDLFKAAGW